MERLNSRRSEGNVPIAAILSLISGIVMIIGGISIIFMFGWYQSMSIANKNNEVLSFKYSKLFVGSII
jgi:hypothetical protein